MSDAARLMIGLSFITIPTIAFGGYFLLSILRRQVGRENITSDQMDYFRAGHAHAGVLVTLNLVGQVALDAARLGDSLTWILRVLLVAAPILISAGFFGGAPRTAGGSAGPLIRLTIIGAVILSIATIGVGVGLLLPPSA